MMDSTNRMHHHVEYRSVISEDISGICKIYNAHIELGGSTFETVPWETSILHDQIMKNDKDIWFVAEMNHTVIGWAAARLHSNRFGYRLTREIAIYLAIEHMGKGIAGQLLKLTENSCIDLGIHHLVARVITSNERSLRFHERAGYGLVGVQKEIGRLNDQWLDVAIMQKILS